MVRTTGFDSVNAGSSPASPAIVYVTTPNAHKNKTT